MKFNYNDGGRSNYFRAESVGDCVTRAIAIASGEDYKVIYDRLFKLQGSSPRNGVYKKVYHKLLTEELGFQWVATKIPGKSETVHMKSDELPSGTIICRLSKHLACVKNGVLNDTYDCTREGTRMVYGYYFKSETL